MAIRCLKALKEETKRERSTSEMCQSLEQCSMGNFIHEVEGEKKKKRAGTDSTQLFSIKPFMASIKCAVSVWAALLEDELD